LYKSNEAYTQVEPDARCFNEFGLPDALHYRTAVVFKVLGISADVFRWRLMVGKYPDQFEKDEWGRRFTPDDIRTLVSLTPPRKPTPDDNAGKQGAVTTGKAKPSWRLANWIGISALRAYVAADRLSWSRRPDDFSPCIAQGMTPGLRPLRNVCWRARQWQMQSRTSLGL
jgi:hypothetical protein